MTLTYAVDERLLQQMVDTIVREVQPLRVVLFGSRATCDPRPDSDVDFLVIEETPFGNGRSRRKEAVRLWKALARFRVPKDILVFSQDEVQTWKDTPGHILYQALQEGRVLYESG